MFTEMSNEKDQNGGLFMFYVYPFIFVAIFFFIGDLFYTWNFHTALIDTSKVLLFTILGFILVSLLYLVFVSVLELLSLILEALLR